MKKFLPLMLCIFTLTGCVSREQADDKLAKACEAGARAFMMEDFEIKETKNKTFKDADGLREVKLSVLESDGWADIDKDYICQFEEQFGFMGMSHTATITQLKFDDQIYGKDGEKIIGSVDDMMKLNDAAEKAMR